MRQEEWTVEAADAYLNEIPKFTSEKHTAEGLRRMLSYLNALPQEERIVHVAGTNGKGSVCSFLDAILQKAGKQTARFTSPHLVRVTERFSFDGQEADDALFLEAFEAVKASYVHFEQEGLGRPTYFEYLFLMFMWMVRRSMSFWKRGLADGWMQRTASSIQRLRLSLRSALTIWNTWAAR